jgi:hypothetical protein
MAIRNHVSVKMDKNYFEKFFEPERRKLSSKLGLNLSQTKFTSYLHRSGAQLIFPKTMNINPIKKRRGKLYLNI